MTKKDNIFYCIVALEYGKRNYIKDREWILGENNNYSEIYELFVKLQCLSPEDLFSKFPKDVFQVQIQLEKCIETEDEIECIQVENEFWAKNPNYKK